MKKQDILQEIIANKRFEIDLQKQSISLEQLQNTLTDIEKKRSMRAALSKVQPAIIAEFKRRSPSKGWIKEDAEIDTIIPAYQAAGAAALSILTDEKFFGGNLSDIRKARSLTDLPIIRKDFIVNEYQLYQAKIIGADAVLLIAAALSKETCTALTQKAHELGLEVLLEIHSEDELDYILPETDMIGVNNRNLGSFYTDVQNSFRLAELLPKNSVLVSESGISDYKTIQQLQASGFKGFLIGETFMKTAKPGNALKEMTNPDIV
ncbi:indole-3-glycerol phosphate synthase TrpC [Bacteroides sp. 519]|uniref:indole-3-glycerol phosphate synthase TrpC n=1 Tax=Bacteroides sp. 519 TaxID=2302937 RepID=UPI0013D3F24C|nr:indole-3-glycerol phosphate synthase TrpC [Bacteroides sp. 519]NDV59553.1 indole-3-glycerol phosphate synthase TrpC [Bacteroides sp. 519]